jgi:MHS family proline/betaine transporter-like MFS transporter
MPDFPAAATTPADATRRLIIAASIGNALEFYEISVYSYFAATLAPLFFPSQDAGLSLLQTYGAFALSFVTRPIGALVLGRFADRSGRKAALLLSISLMMGSTLLLSCLPTYAAIGFLAPLGLILSRFVQGFAVAGEFAASTALLAEYDESRKGYLASWQFASQGISVVLASLLGVFLSSALDAQQLSSWGWRVPFLVGLAIGPIGLYVRRHLHESALLEGTPVGARTPLFDLWRHQRAPTLLATLIVSVSTGTNYLIAYMPSFAIRHLQLSESVGFSATLLAGVVLIVACPMFGRLSDRLGPLRIMRVVALIALVSALPAFALLTHFGTAAALLATLAWFALLKAAYAGPMPALMSDLFGVGSRASGLALAYNFGVMVFGGLAPWESESLIRLTGSTLAPAVTLVTVAIIALAALALAPRWLAPSRAARRVAAEDAAVR